MAAALSGATDYEPEWELISEQPASNIWQPPEHWTGNEVLIIVGGWSPPSWKHPGFDAWLRRRAAGGAIIGAIGSAVHTVARSGLLNTHQSALHPDILAGFKERHSDLDANRHLYSIDEKRFTCAGGTAVLDMMICLVAGWYGVTIANQIACKMLHVDVRAPDVAPAALSNALGRVPQQLKALVRLMENNIEFPLSISDLADQSGMSPRQVQRLFHDYLGVVPLTHYREIRLQHARRLLRQTDISITEIAFASGFANSSHFTRCFKEQFSITPFAERIAIPAAIANGSGVSIAHLL